MYIYEYSTKQANDSVHTFDGPWRKCAIFFKKGNKRVLLPRNIFFVTVIDVECPLFVEKVCIERRILFGDVRFQNVL